MLAWPPRRCLVQYLTSLQIKTELIEERDYGAFKEKIDHGLPTRKAAYECLQTLLEEASHKITLSEFIGHIRKGGQKQQSILCLGLLTPAHQA